MSYLRKIDESFIKLEGFDWDYLLTIKNYFSFYTENYKWHPKFKAGVWDGKISLCDLRSQKMPQGLLKDLVVFLKESNIEFTIDKNFKLEKQSREYILSIIHNIIEQYGCQLKLRDYQEEAIVTAIQQRKAGIVSATGSGKSFIQFLIAEYIKQELDEPVILIVPTVNLVEQMYFDIMDYSNNILADDVAKIYSGQSKEVKPLTISTWQSLQDMPNNYFENFGGVLVDEFHGSEAKVLTKIINNTNNARYKIGMSGSLRDAQVSTVQLTGLFGQIKTVSTSSELIKKGVLSDVKINTLILEHDKKITRPALGEKFTYQDEVNYLSKNKDKIKILLKLAKKCKGNTLIIFRNIKYGKLLCELAEKHIDKKVMYVSGETKTEIREQVRHITEESDDVLIFASIGTFSTGINIKKLHNVIFAQSMKSKINVIQTIGRLLRKHKSKDCAVIYDIVDDLKTKKKNYTLKHALDRIKIYEKEKFNYQIKKIKL